jgi:hypothetical protein
MWPAEVNLPVDGDWPHPLAFRQIRQARAPSARASRRGGHVRDSGDDDGGLGESGQEDWVDEAEVLCPHCGERVVIALDPAGGAHQEYVEDCEICCRPWQVQVHYAGGSVDVSVEPA